MYTYIYICMICHENRIYTYIHIYIYIYIYVCTYIYIYIYILFDIYIYIYISFCLYIFRTKITRIFCICPCCYFHWYVVYVYIVSRHNVARGLMHGGCICPERCEGAGGEHGERLGLLQGLFSAWQLAAIVVNPGR